MYKGMSPKLILHKYDMSSSLKQIIAVVLIKQHITRSAPLFFVMAGKNGTI